MVMLLFEFFIRVWGIGKTFRGVLCHSRELCLENSTCPSVSSGVLGHTLPKTP